MNTFKDVFGKERDAADQHLSFSHDFFYPSQSEMNELNFFVASSAFNLDVFQICCLVKRLTNQIF